MLAEGNITTSITHSYDHHNHYCDDDMIMYNTYRSLLREKSPIIHVMMNDVALYPVVNLIQSFGCKPTASHHAQDIPDICKIAHSHCLNLGMMNHDKMQSLNAIIKHEHAAIMLDCVMIHYYQERLKIAKEIAKNAAIIKGNQDEMALLNHNDYPQAIFIVTGAKNTIYYQGEHIITIDGGDNMMANVVALGCVIGALLTMVIAVIPAKDRLKTIISIMSIITVTGRHLATQNNITPINFLTQWQQALYQLTKNHQGHKDNG